MNNRGQQLTVKLTSFELTTAVNTDTIRRRIAHKYGAFGTKGCESGGSDDSSNGYSFVKHRHEILKQKYAEKSKKQVFMNCLPTMEHSYMNVRSDLLQYNKNFRQHLSVFNYQAPELLIGVHDFILPTIGADVYSMTLLLWEVMNQFVPYVVYSQHTLESLYRKRQAYLPIFEKNRCRHFSDILIRGLQVNPAKRNLTMDDFIGSLIEATDKCDRVETIHGDNSDVAMNVSYENNYQNVGMEKKNNRNNNSKSFSIDKPLPPIPMTPEQILAIERSTAPNKYINFNDSTFNNQSLIEFNECLTTPISGGKERTSTMKIRNPSSTGTRFPNVKLTRELFSGTSSGTTDKDEIVDNDSFTLLNEEFNAISTQFTNNKNLITEEVFNNIKSNKSDKIIGPLVIKENQLPTKMCITEEQKKFLNNCLEDTESIGSPDRFASESVNESVKMNYSTTSKSVDNHLNYITPINPTQRRPAQVQSVKEIGYDTPIARKNKIRRNAWLSDQKLNITEDTQQPERLKLFDKENNNAFAKANQSSFNLVDRENNNTSAKVNQSIHQPSFSSCKDTNGNISLDKTTESDYKDFADRNNRLNVSIRIVHSKVTPSPAKKEHIEQKQEKQKNLENKSILSQMNCWKFGGKRTDGPSSMCHQHIDIGQNTSSPKIAENILNDVTAKTDISQQIRDLSTDFNRCLSSSHLGNVTSDFDQIATDLNITSNTNLNSEFERVFAKQKESKLSANGSFKKHWCRENKRCENASPTAAVSVKNFEAANISKTGDSGVSTDEDVLWTPVKDTIKQFENWLAQSNTPNRKRTGSKLKRSVSSPERLSLERDQAASNTIASNSMIEKSLSGSSSKELVESKANQSCNYHGLSTNCAGPSNFSRSNDRPAPYSRIIESTSSVADHSNYSGSTYRAGSSSNIIDPISNCAVPSTHYPSNYGVSSNIIESTSNVPDHSSYSRSNDRAGSSSNIVDPIIIGAVNHYPSNYGTGLSSNIIESTSNFTGPSSMCGNSQTLIKRTIVRESIVSGLNLSQQLDSIFDRQEINTGIPGRKLTTCVTLNMRQTRRRASDLGFNNAGPSRSLSNSRHSICGNEMEMICKPEAVRTLNRNVCCQCATAIPKEKLRTCK